MFGSEVKGHTCFHALDTLDEMEQRLKKMVSVIVVIIRINKIAILFC